MNKWSIWFLGTILLCGVVLGDGENVVLSTYLDEEIYIGQEYTKLFKIKIENQVDCSSKKDLITVHYSITKDEVVKEDFFEREIGCSGYANTGEFTPLEVGEYTLCGEIVESTVEETNLEDNSACMDFVVLDTSEVACDVSLNITANGDFFYEKGESIKFKTELNNKEFPFEIEYWIEDLFGNIYKKKYVTANTNQKSWKTKISEEDRILFIKARVTPSCNDENLDDNYAELMFAVINEVEEEEEVLEELSTIKIGKISPAEISFGEVVNAEVEIYKGSTGKYSLSAWIMKNGKTISQKTKFHLKDKYTNYKLFLPIQLKPNCNEKIDDGKASLVVEGLGEKVEQELSISGINEKLCQEIEIEVEVEKVNEKEESLCLLSGDVVDEDTLDSELTSKVSAGNEKIWSEVDGIVIYESSSAKASKLIPYLIMAMLGLFCAILIWKK
ncbi:hypothetical protein GOV03_03655 [Candidatus Woesearchaeota archaeon]|nr:hypothetical protein [Candidatus Woesearchaeota archaeon]